MDDTRVDQALAHATAALQEHHDLTGFLVDLIAACQQVLAVDATGIMVLSRHGRLQLLAASTHRSAELELYQSQIDEGPCVDAAASDQSVIVADAATLRATWPRFGPAMLKAKFQSVHSAPLRWEGSTLGAMALFRHEPVALDGHEDQTAQAFADVVAHAVMNTGEPKAPTRQERVEAALAGRMVVEQAKGVIAQAIGIDMPEAYEVLIAQARLDGQTLTVTANKLIVQAQRGELDLA